MALKTKVKPKAKRVKIGGGRECDAQLVRWRSQVRRGLRNPQFPTEKYGQRHRQKILASVKRNKPSFDDVL